MFELDPKPARLHQTLTVTIEGRPPTPNVRRHWRQIQHDNAEWKTLAETVAANERRKWERKHGLAWRPVMRADLTVVFMLKDKRTRDLDNLIASTKPLLDGIVAAGLIVDDSIAVIESMTFRAITSGSVGTLFIVEEVEP